jgi:hypothetical protein
MWLYNAARRAGPQGLAQRTSIHYSNAKKIFGILKSVALHECDLHIVLVTARPFLNRDE